MAAFSGAQASAGALAPGGGVGGGGGAIGRSTSGESTGSRVITLVHSLKSLRKPPKARAAAASTSLYGVGTPMSSASSVSSGGGGSVGGSSASASTTSAAAAAAVGGAKGAIKTQWVSRLAADEGRDKELQEFTWESNGHFLAQFDSIVMVGSQQDGYTPHHSHRVEVCPAAQRDSSSRSRAYHHMVQSFWDGVDMARVMKLEVSFPGVRQTRVTVNSILGREAHLAFLDSMQFAVQFVLCHPHLFET